MSYSVIHIGIEHAMPLVVWTISHIFAAARFVEFMLLLTRRKGDKSLLSTQYFEQMVSRMTLIPISRLMMVTSVYGWSGVILPYGVRVT